MTAKEILKADMLDILFDNRNKQYGAYPLRKYYNNRMGTSLGIALSLMLLLFFVVRPDHLGKWTPVESGELKLTTVVVPREPKRIIPVQPKETTPSPARTLAANKLTTFIIKENTTDHVATRDQLQEALISNRFSTGDPATLVQPIVTLPTPQGGNGDNQNAPELPTREPEFPGGKQAWLNFLNNNLRVPGDLEAGEKKTVYIKFDVATDGAVTNFEVIQSAGAVYDNEVIRVLKKMPRWKPALQRGEAVSRSFTQPVTFMGLE